VVLAQFSTRLPPELLERLRRAAPQLGLHQCEITAAALDAFLKAKGH
jgi:predicted DNA-binding protein